MMSTGTYEVHFEDKRGSHNLPNCEEDGNMHRSLPGT